MKKFGESPSSSHLNTKLQTDIKAKEEFTTQAFAEKLKNLELEPQQEIGAIGYFLLRQRAQEVGMNSIKDFDPASIATWDEYHEHFWSDFRNGNLQNTEAVYSSSLNKITSNDGGKSASLSTFTHEMAHYVSDVQNLPNQSENKERFAKTGFTSNYSEKGNKDLGAYRNSFRLLNEGVTEKITHDLCDGITVEKLGSLYKAIFPEKTKKNIEKARKQHQEWLKKIEVTEKDMQTKELAEFSEFIKKVTNEDDKEMYTKAHQGRMGMIQRMREQRERDLVAIETLPVQTDDPLANKDEVSYSEMVDLVTLIVDGIALASIKNQSVSFEEARSITWKNMQKAYFSGNIHYLRILDSIYGEGFLRKIGSLDYDDVVIDEKNETIEWREYDEVKGIIESTNISLKN